MAYREVTRVEIGEVIRRWQAGEGLRKIASGTGLSRITVRKYVAAAQELGLSREGAGPSEEQLNRLAGISQSGPRQVQIPSEEVLAPWADQVYQWLTGDRLQLTRIQELLAARGCRISYSSLHRWIRRRNWRRQSGTVRMEDTAELDFGRLGLVHDPETGRRRTAWALVVVLAYSRHSFVWPTFSQKLEDVIQGLEAAWAFFGGVPRYLVIDNFPAAVAGADALHPRLTRGFLEYSQHRGFIADPARVRHPKDKPHVERGVQYVRERFFKSSNFASLEEMRLAAKRWCLDVAGLRVHGTTRRRPLQVFQDEERQAMAEWDGEPYEVTHWRTAKVHPDHHVACQYALYSVPSSLCPPGQRVEIGLGSKLVRIYHRGRLLKLHPRQPRGGRSTDAAGYPTELTAYTLRAPRASSAARPSRGRRWPNSPSGSLTVPFHGPRSGRDTIWSAWDSATRRSVWTTPAAGPWTWTSSTCAGWNASWYRHWSGARRRSIRRRCLRDASPGPGPSSPMLKEVRDDPHNRSYAPAQTAPAGAHGRHPARAHRPGPQGAAGLRLLPGDHPQRRGQSPRRPAH